jgi:uncharacterized protein YndB with AHSA1/START domain
MRVDEQAPVIGSSEGLVAAPSEVVWDVLTDFEGWPGWNPDVKAMTVEGAVAEGTKFRWKAGPGTIRSRVERLDRPRLAGWTGKTLGIDAVHVWHLEPRDGGTFVRTEESFSGFLPRLLRGRMQKTLDAALETGLQHLRVAAERRASAAG